jgi:RNA polymerase sigma-70 factor (ECF subfamily)
MARPIDRNEVDRLVVEHLPAALRLAVRLTGDAHTAEDVVQESLCRVLRRYRSYRGEAAFKTWMLQIVLNVDRDRRRRQRDVQPLETSQAITKAASPLEQAAAGELQTNVNAAIDRLPERQREVALLSLGEGLPARDVAHILNTTESNVHTCLHLARKRIAQAIGTDYVRQDRS